jgi:CBS domain-containing protein
VVAIDIMMREVVTVGEEVSVDELCDMLQEAHVNGLPVVNAEGMLVGIVTEEDVLYGSMGHPPGHESSGGPEERVESPDATPAATNGAATVQDIMTSPAVCATEETRVEELCRMMWQMRIHRIPIVRDGRVTGIVSAMDIVRAISEGRIRV